ncbi:hypothetical protein ABEW34_16180 [Paenibacillus algorifonticola]|uniref:hypothetical protein n=1 Tax=Paenibacillus algorifonticola TaxID=684063 RepID=UPI003D2771EC
MEHADEKILKLLQEMETLEHPKTIHAESIRVGVENYVFEPVFFFDERLSVHLPSQFTDMDEQSRKAKYPYEERPEIIKANADGSIAFTLKVVDENLSDPWVDELTNGMKGMVKRANPANVFYTTEVEEINGKRIGFFDFKSSALDGYLYTIMFFLALDGQAVIGSFTCPYSLYADWREIAYQMLQSIRVYEEAEEEVQA